MNTILLHESINFKKEFYFAIVMDRVHQGPVFIASPQGGVDIEEVAHSNPDAIITVRLSLCAWSLFSSSATS